MKLEVFRYKLEIIPETEQDKAYLEEVFGLKEDEDRCVAERKNSIGLSCWGYLEIRPGP